MNTCIINQLFKPTFLYIKQHTKTGKLYFGKTVSKNIEKYPGSGVYWTKHIAKHGKEHVITLWYCLFTEESELTKFALTFSKIHNIVGSNLWANQMEENGVDNRLGTTHSNSTKKLISEKRKQYYNDHAHPMIGVKRGPQSEELIAKRADSIKEFYSNNPAAKEVASLRAKEMHKQNPEMAKNHSKRMTGEGNSMYGNVRPIEWKESHSKFMKENNPMTGRTGVLSPLYGVSPPNKGKLLNELHSAAEVTRIRDAMSIRARNRTQLICPHCGLSGQPSNMKRWHFDNCKIT